MVDEGFDLAVNRCLPRRDRDGRFSPFSDESANEIQSQLEHHSELSSWATCPRTFGLLHLAGFPFTEIKKLPAAQFNDGYLPYRKLDLQHIEGLDQKRFDAILNNQELILSEPSSMAKERFLEDPVKEHRHIKDGNAYFEPQRQLGVSSTAVVTVVKHRTSGGTFAAKKLPRTDTRATEQERWDFFHKERSILLRLNHVHIVRCVGTYTDQKSFTLILNPLAEHDLQTVLKDKNADLASRYATVLHTAFGCLATAVAYLHINKVRHKDIKPGNVLLKGQSVFLCDFGISLDWSDRGGATTGGTDIGPHTPIYFPPEAGERKPRNQQSDIWSLGCVFLEIATKLSGQSVDELRGAIIDDAGQGEYYHNHEAILGWLTSLKQFNRHKEPLKWIRKMLRTSPEDRPRAHKLAEAINGYTSMEGASQIYIGQCCMPQGVVERFGQLGITVIQPDGSRPDANLVPSRPYFARMDTPPASENSASVALDMDQSIAASSGEDDEYTKAAQPRPRSPIPRPSRDASSEHQTHHSDQEISSPEQSILIELISVEIVRYTLNGRCVPFSGHSSFTLSIFESNDPSIWKRYRWFKIHDVREASSEQLPRLCCSMWLPLSGVRITNGSNNSVELRWSDCNTWVPDPKVDHEKTFSKAFSVDSTNNALTADVPNQNDGVKIRRFLLNDCLQSDYLLNSRPISVNFGGDQLKVYSISSEQRAEYTEGPSRDLDHHLVNVIHHNEAIDTSRLYMAGRRMDLDFKEILMGQKWEIRINNAMEPNYISDVVNERVMEDSIIGNFKEVEKKSTNLLLTTSSPVSSSLSLHEANQQNRIPGCSAEFRDLIRALSGWTLKFYAKAEMRKTKLLSGLISRSMPADVMFWRLPRRSMAKVVIRSDTEKPDRWLAGSFTGSSTIELRGKSSAIAVITIENISKAKTFGRLLGHVFQETSQSSKEQYRITFSSQRHRLHFFTEVQGFVDSLSLSDNATEQRTTSLGRATTARIAAASAIFRTDQSGSPHSNG